MSNTKYDPKMAQYAFEVNARLGIPEEQTALAIAQACGKEQEFQEALKDRKKGWIFRRHGEDITTTLAMACLTPPENSSTFIEGKYILMPKTSRYAQGVHALQNACRAEAVSAHPPFITPYGRTYRPLTFKENIEARVHDYESNKDSEERLRLFQRWNDSCTAIAYKKRTTKFKIVLNSQELITIPEDFNRDIITVNYDHTWGVELDRNDATYNNLLTPAQVENHPAWLAALEGDSHLLKTYRDIVFANLSQDKAMGFWLRTGISEDQLRALFVNNLNYDSVASGSNNLGGNGSFLRVAPVVAR
ncbi:MAG: hypothetical protein Q7S55_03920 [Nanoarchaeota archaeon]|nr:hypothetical protein [Nanoarchaeota archaeon]